MLFQSTKSLVLLLMQYHHLCALKNLKSELFASQGTAKRIFVALNLYLSRNSKNLMITVICGFNSRLGETDGFEHVSILVLLRSATQTKPDPLPEVLNGVTLEWGAEGQGVGRWVRKVRGPQRKGKK